MKRIVLSSFGLLVGLMLVFSSFAPVLANGNGQETCPSGDGWDKVDGLSGTSYTYTAPAGKEIVAWCYKAATTVNSGDVVPPASSYTVTSTVTNQNGQVQDLSHASFKLQDIPVTNEARLIVVNDCTGGHIEISANNGGTYPSLPSWTWTNPYALEAVPGGSVTVTWTSGTPLSMTLPYDTIYEPKECQTPLPHTYKVEIVNNCDGYEWKVTVDKGTFEADMPLFGKWIDKYTQEESPVPTISITWEDGYNEKVTLDKIIEPTNCVVVDEHKFVVTPKVNCDGYSWKIDVTNGKYEVIDGSLSGVWTDKHTQEKSPNPTVKLTWDDGYTKTVKLDTITEPANCVPEQPTPEPTPTPVPQETGAGDGLPWMFPVGLIVVGLSLAGIFWPKH